MRKLVELLLVAAAAAAWGACAAHPRPELANREPKPETACADWRLIAIRSQSAAACPVVPGWDVEPLFAPAREAKKEVRYGYRQAAAAAEESNRKLSPVDVRAELDRFCTYERRGGSWSSPRQVPTVGRDLVRVDKDCAALSIAGDAEVPEEVWTRAKDQFLAQSGQPPAPLTITNQEGVRLAFLDTEPRHEDDVLEERRGYSWHGYTMAWIARNLICSSPIDGPCAAKVTTRLALPLASFDARSKTRTRVGANGGHVGTQRDLAKAIFDEVEEWLPGRDDPEGQQHLVINLSLAWDPRLFAGLAEDEIAELRAGSQAVYRALQYAASEDVLVLASAGNKKLCPGVPATGPLLPAAWESEGPRASCSVPERPLLYAVGGLGADGGPLGIGRDGGMPPRAAYAEHAAVRTWGDQPSAMYSGTSVAAAVASAIAAIVWDTAPHLSPAEVMEVLETDSSANDLAFAADFGRRSGTAGSVGFAPPRVHRLSLCHAVREACVRAGGPSCPVSLVEECPEVPPAVTSAGLSADTSVPTTCQPWVFPQPEAPPCPTCVKEPPG